MGLRKRYAYTIESFNELLDDVVNKRVSGETADRAIISYLQSKQFLGMLFNPPEDIERAEIQKQTKDMYVLMCHRKALKAVISAIEEETYDGYGEFNRSVATFLNTIAMAAITASNDFVDRLKNDIGSGKIDRRDARAEFDHIDAYNDTVRKLIKTSTKIIKRMAKRLAYETGIPYEICRQAYLDVPDPRYINKYQIGFYANKVLSNIYETVDQYDVTLDHVSWKNFFQEIFSDPNVVEISNYILLEGMDRINDYKGSEVKDAWNDLTRFALDTLEDAPEQIQNQMMDLYTKRVSRMFDNNIYEVRTDLRNLDPEEYPHLTKVISKYVDQITEIIKNAAKRADD